MNIRQSRLRPHAEVSTAPLNDIMFFLLLFFLIVSTMVSPSVVKLTLPSAKNAQTMNKTPVKLEVSADLRYVLAGKEIAFENLEAAMAEAVKGVESPTVVLSLDKSLNIQQLVDVLEIGNRLKVKMILATRAPNG
ncbi:MAG: biopolymer transporter ExbD [Bacteroidia bacterium]|mgnify:CR=1 FL=1|jgi:biopolymer transport protein ExbD|nr:biopolymer transporter ExbD [Bacteroidia bacterium]MCC6768348.1 biopolymer transporter ExbD [Bacteroidia bacterium]